MAQLVKLDSRATVIAQLFETNKKRMISLAPRSTGNPERIFQIAFQNIAYNTDLLVCTQESLIGGVFEAIKLGITLGGPMQEGWLIPFKDHGGTPKAVLVVGYMGYRNIIDRAGSVVDMQPRAVHVKDEFDYWFGDAPRIIHRPKMPTPQKREDLRAAYVVANLRKGGRQMEVLELDEIDAHRNRSRAKNSGPWVTDFVPMALKTGMRKISKYLPKSNELLARALDLDEKADLGLDQQFEIPPGVTIVDEGDPTKSTGSPMDRLKESIGASRTPAADRRAADVNDAELDAQAARESGDQ